MKRILHVEDDALIVLIYRPALVRAGFSVEVAEDGLIASKMLFKSRPDLVVLDLLLPKLEGADVIKFIRSKPNLKSLPVIVLSQAGIADQGVTAAALGADRILYKSHCTPAILISAINELLGRAVPDDCPPVPPNC
jgi:DNA-binding response OmpR family regulator